MQQDKDNNQYRESKADSTLNEAEQNVNEEAEDVRDDAQRTDRPRLEPVVDDLDARNQRVDVLCDRGVRMATVDRFDINADAEGELGLDDACVNWSAPSVARCARRRWRRRSASATRRRTTARSRPSATRAAWCST